MNKGDIILYRSIINEPQGKLYLARTDPFDQHGVQVIMLTGYRGYVSCDHCTVIDPARIKELSDAVSSSDK